jgi:hypothetical protein
MNILDDSSDIVSTRLINHKVTLLHRRLWPSIARAAEFLGVSNLSVIHSEHTASGAHRSFEIEYPLWVPTRRCVTPRYSAPAKRLPSCQSAWEANGARPA